MDVFFDWRWWLINFYTIWDNISAHIRKEFDSEPVYNKYILRTKIKSHDDEITDFYSMEIPEQNSSHTYLAVIRMDPALKKDETYFPKAFLK